MSCMAERQGFEPWIPCGIHAFQACAFSHSAISPQSLAAILNLSQGLERLVGGDGAERHCSAVHSPATSLHLPRDILRRDILMNFVASLQRERNAMQQVSLEGRR